MKEDKRIVWFYPSDKFACYITSHDQRNWYHFWKSNKPIATSWSIMLDCKCKLCSGEEKFINKKDWAEHQIACDKYFGSGEYTTSQWRSALGVGD